MDDLRQLLKNLQTAWATLCGGDLKLLPTPPEHAANVAVIHYEDKSVAWLVGTAEHDQHLAQPLLDSWAATLSPYLKAYRTSQNLADELIVAWNRLNFMHEITALIRTIPDYWSMVESVLKLAQTAIGAERAFAMQIADGELVNRFVGKALGEEDLWTMVVVLENHARPLICDDAETCAQELAGIEGLQSFMGMQLPVTLGLPTFVGLINQKDGKFSPSTFQLFDSLVEQLTTVLEIQALHRLELRTEQINRDLSLAAAVQSSFLPSALPEVSGYEFSARLLSASQIGGDFYDFFQRGEQGTTGIVVCDVAGKGISAALMAADVRAAVRYALDSTTDPGIVLASANTHLYPDMERIETFATAILLTLPENSVPHYASAGHTSALWIRADDCVIEELRSTSIPLGILPDIASNSITVGLRPGDLILLYSDGLTESQNDAGDILGLDRIKDVLLATHTAPLDFILDSLVDLRKRHRGSGDATDDLTLVAVRRNLNKPFPDFCTWLYLPGDIRSLNIAHDELGRLQTWLPDTEEYQRWYMQVRLALIEAVTNIFNHAYQDGPGDVHGLVHVIDSQLRIDLYDRGLTFKPPDTFPTEINLDEIPEGGYGLGIINKVMDEIHYERLPGGVNHWRFARHLPH